MTCTAPFCVRLASGRMTEVPCGRCLSCRIARNREWATRCLHEATEHQFNGFVTLTYRDDFLPAGGSVSREDFQKFMKRLRKSWEPRRVRYFGCGEYGERNGRPHYHLMLFGVRPCQCSTRVRPDEYCECVDRRAIMDAWRKGGVDRVGTVTYDSARYCADYVGKSHSITEYREGLAKPFIMMSQGLGRVYVDKNRTRLLEDLGVTVEGVAVRLPRYYSKRLGVVWREIERGEFLRDVPAWSIREGHFVRPDEGDVALQRVQVNANVVGRKNLFRKGGL